MMQSLLSYLSIFPRCAGQRASVVLMAEGMNRNNSGKASRYMSPDTAELGRELEKAMNTNDELMRKVRIGLQNGKKRRRMARRERA